tara:strand:+ start:2966 stop:5794 length:2829 start_codon:yes stop_codon:yes gene_type:complete
MNTYSLSVLGSESSSFIFSNKGVVDFSSKVDARKTNKVIHESYIVKGEMLFNWGEFVDPKDLVSFQKPDSFREVTIPHFWGKDKNAKKIGSGTYLLNVLNSPFKRVGLKVSIKSAHKIFILIEGRSPIEVSSQGHVSLKENRIIPWWENQYSFFDLGGEKNFKILVHVSNNYFREGRFLKLELGDERIIRTERSKGARKDFFVMGGLIIFGFYFLYLYIRNTKDKQVFFFSLLSLLIAYRLGFTERYIPFLFSPDLVLYQVLLRMEYLSFFVFPYLYGKIIFVMFPYLLPKKFKDTVNIVSLTFCLSCLMTPSIEFLSGTILKFYHPFFLSIFVLYFYYMIQAARHKLKFSFLSIFALFLGIIGFIHDALIEIGYLNPPHRADFFILGTVFLMALFLAEKNVRNYQKYKKRAYKFKDIAKEGKDQLAKERDTYHIRLEEEIKRKTSIIYEQNKKLEVERISLEDLMSHYYFQKKSKDTLINNLDNGYMTFREDGTIHDGASKVTEDILGRSLYESESRGHKIWDALFFDEESKSFFKKWIKKAWEGKLSFKDLLPLAPKIYRMSKDSYIEIDYKPIYVSGEDATKKNELDRIIVILKDKTNQKRQELKIKRSNEDAEFIENALNNPVEFLDILEDTNELLKNIPALDDFNHSDIQREVHTLKARFATLGMKFASSYLHMVEELLSSKKTEQVRNALNYFRGELSKHLKRHSAIVQAAKKTMVDDGLAIPVNKIMELIKEIPNYEDFHFHIYKNYFLSDLLLKINRYKGLTQEIASGQGKSVIWKNEGEKIIVDTERYGSFVNSLVHVFRNMVDHGIESEDERIEKHKGKSGIITVQSKVNGENFELRIFDDGRGIDHNQIKKQLIKKGLKVEDDFSDIKPEDIIQFIFLPNFSTKEEVSQISGRGIGMDAVKVEVEKLGGEIKVSSKVEEGTSVIFELPIII